MCPSFSTFLLLCNFPSRFAPFYHLTVDSNSTGLFLQRHLCFFATGTFCSRFQANLSFFPPSVCSSFFLSVSLLFPHLIRRTLDAAAEGSGDYIDSTDGHSCHLLCRKPPCLESRSHLPFLGFPRKQPQLSEGPRSPLSPSIRLSSISHGPSITKRRSAFVGLFSVWGLGGFEHLFQRLFSFRHLHERGRELPTNWLC